MTGRALSHALVIVALLVAATARAGDVFFKWIDGRGDLHVTDVLAEVPEPYYSMYKGKLAEREGTGGKSGAAVTAPSSPPAATDNAAAPAAPEGQPLSAKIAAQRAEWRALVATWRQELAAATADVEQLDSELGELQMNPILRETPAIHARVNELEDRRRGALERLEKARRMLLVELPARAKKEGVAPGWLL